MTNPKKKLHCDVYATYVCMYAYIYIYIYIYTHTHTHIYIYIYVYTHTYIHAHGLSRFVLQPEHKVVKRHSLDKAMRDSHGRMHAVLLSFFACFVRCTQNAPEFLSTRHLRSAPVP